VGAVVGNGKADLDRPFQPDGRFRANVSWLVSLALLAVLAASTASAAGLEADSIEYLYELRLAPVVCHWVDAGDKGRLDATIDELERKAAITPSDELSLTTMAEADLRSDPAKCEREGSVGRMYDDAVQFDD